MQEWLATRGLCAIRLIADHVGHGMIPMVHCILTGPSPRNPVLHAVVGLYDGLHIKMVHDPHPDGTGLAGPPEFVTFIGKLV